MTLAELKDILEAEVVSGHERLDEIVSGAFCADLMSDVLSFAKPGCVLITGLANLQALRTAYALDLGAVIVCRGKALPEGFVDAARDLGIPVLRTRLIMFEASGRLWMAGVEPSARERRGKSEVVSDATA